MDDPIETMFAQLAAQPKLPRRPHHYQFAHRMLPELTFRAADQLVTMAVDGVITARLNLAWTTLGERMPPADRLSSDGLGATLHAVRGGHVIVVRMPPPDRSPEAYFAAIAVLGPDQVHYLTLERGVTLEGGPRTVLCGWDHDRHANYGDGTEVDEGAFLGRVRHLLDC